MSELEEPVVAEEGEEMLDSFGKINPGVQRIIIAVVLVVILVAVVVLKQMIGQEEKARHDEEDVIEYMGSETTEAPVE